MRRIILSSLALLLVWMTVACAQVQNQPDRRGRRNGNLAAACGAKGMAADFVTGNCVSPSGRQVNPANLYQPFQSPMPEPSPGELIMRCEGRAVDFVTGRCM